MRTPLAAVRLLAVALLTGLDVVAGVAVIVAAFGSLGAVDCYTAVLLLFLTGSSCGSVFCAGGGVAE